MKYFLLSLFLLSWAGCKTPDASRGANQRDTARVAVLQSVEDTLWFANFPENNPDRSYLLGKLQPGSRLQLKTENIMMTRISMQMAVAPESGYLNIASEQIGKWAIVGGHWAGDLYEAEVVCIFNQSPSARLFRRLRHNQANLEDYCQ